MVDRFLPHLLQLLCAERHERVEPVPVVRPLARGVGLGSRIADPFFLKEVEVVDAIVGRTDGHDILGVAIALHCERARADGHQRMRPDEVLEVREGLFRRAHFGEEVAERGEKASDVGTRPPELELPFHLVDYLVRCHRSSLTRLWAGLKGSATSRVA